MSGMNQHNRLTTSLTSTVVLGGRGMGAEDGPGCQIPDRPVGLESIGRASHWRQAQLNGRGGALQAADARRPRRASGGMQQLIFSCAANSTWLDTLAAPPPPQSARTSISWPLGVPAQITTWHSGATRRSPSAPKRASIRSMHARGGGLETGVSPARRCAGGAAEQVARRLDLTPAPLLRGTIRSLRFAMIDSC